MVSAFFAALRQLGSFDHGACDDALRARGIEVANVKLHGSPGDAAIYGGSYFVLFWSLAVVVTTIRAYYRRNRGTLPSNQRAMLYLGPVFCAMAVIFIGLQVTAIEAYVAACRAVLHVHEP